MNDSINHNMTILHDVISGELYGSTDDGIIDLPAGGFTSVTGYPINCEIRGATPPGNVYVDCMAKELPWVAGFTLPNQ